MSADNYYNMIIQVHINQIKKYLKDVMLNICRLYCLNYNNVAHSLYNILTISIQVCNLN